MNKDVIQGDCPSCPYADLFVGFCSYYRFYPANINFGEATCRCEELIPRHGKKKACVFIKEAIRLVGEINTDMCCGKFYKKNAKALLTNALKELED